MPSEVRRHDPPVLDMSWVRGHGSYWLVHVDGGRPRGVVEGGRAGLAEGTRLHVEVPPDLGQTRLGGEGELGRVDGLGETLVGHVEVLLRGAHVVASRQRSGPQLGLHRRAEPLRALRDVVAGGDSLVIYWTGAVEAHGTRAVHGAHLIRRLAEAHGRLLLEAHGSGSTARSHVLKPLGSVKARHGAGAGALSVEPRRWVLADGPVVAARALRMGRAIEPAHSISSHRTVGDGRAVKVTLSIKPLWYIVPPVITARLVKVPRVLVAARPRSVVGPGRVRSRCGRVGSGRALEDWPFVPGRMEAFLLRRRVCRGAAVLVDRS